MAKPFKKYAAGFTLVELVAVLLILSSLTWLFIKSFSSTAHSSFQFVQVLQQFTARAQSLSFANQGVGAYPSIQLSISADQASISLFQGAQALETYQQRASFKLFIDNKMIGRYPITWQDSGYLLAGGNRRFDFKASGSESSYCLLTSGEWLNGQDAESC